MLHSPGIHFQEPIQNKDVGTRGKNRNEPPWVFPPFSPYPLISLGYNQRCGVLISLDASLDCSIYRTFTTTSSQHLWTTPM